MPGVPGKGGRVPKRADQRLGHRAKAEKEAVESLDITGPVDPGELLVEAPHPIVQELWDAALASAQRRFMEPTDWAQLQLVLNEIQDYLNAHKKNGQILATLMSALGDLLFTEGHRRRARLEINRDGEKPKAPVIDMEAMRKAMGG
ncbi:hypothetical protein HUO13_12135 [Saccharopolyspora erythraea]|uniref:phage terminase small subunit n=1 Tax=Saccharopolyspora erythraea TaxID=1836 RepID=UPI001BA911DE|nr:hypothetical protein [Saccharopolyspora erythraea]QUH01462.1 hypothetical protein HUO13_12135 [Saccharopolyspora erythraea]